MITRWTAHLPEDDKNNFKRRIYESKDVLERLLKIIEEDEATLDRSELNPKAYESPSWAYLQAHKNGMRQYICQVKTLIDLDQQEGSLYDLKQSIRANRG